MTQPTQPFRPDAPKAQSVRAKTAPVSPPMVEKPAAPVSDRFGGKLDSKYFGTIDLAERTKTAGTMWWGGRSLSQVHNAHKSNTREQLEEALRGGYNFLEGDIREEINHDGRLEMRHDKTHEGGDNLTLKEWLEIGKASGRGLKLDFKEAQFTPQILKTVEDVGVPQDRLMFNLGYDDMQKWGDEIRKKFPNATLALNPPPNDGKMSVKDAQKMVAQAKQFGLPVTFVARFDWLTDDVIKTLEASGPVSVWNSQFEGQKVEDPAKEAAKLRDRGVSGVIDLRESAGFKEKAEAWFEAGKGGVQTGFDKAKGFGKKVLGKIF